MSDAAKPPILAANAMFRFATELLARGDLINFKRLAEDIEAVRLESTFLGGLLTAEAAKLWLSERSFRANEVSISASGAQGDLVVHHPGIGLQRIKRDGRSVAEFLHQPALWDANLLERADAGTGNSSTQPAVEEQQGDSEFRQHRPECSAVANQSEEYRWQRWGPEDSQGWSVRGLVGAEREGAERREILTAVASGSLVQLFVSPDETEVSCAFRGTPNGECKSVWRTVLHDAGHAEECVPRALWESGGLILMVLRSREVVVVDAACGREIVRSAPLSGLRRVLDFDRSKGVLVERHVSGMHGRSLEVGRLDCHRLEYERVSCRRRQFEKGELLTGAWCGEGVLLVLRGEPGCLASRLESYIWPTQTAVRDRRSFKSELHQGLNSECDARLSGQDFDPRHSFGRSVMVARIPAPPAVEVVGAEQVILGADREEVFCWSPPVATPPPSSDQRRVLSVQLNPQLPSVLRRGVGGKAWISADGATALLASGWGFDAVDLRTMERVGGFSFSSGLIRKMRSALSEGLDRSHSCVWSEPEPDFPLLEPDGYPVPAGVWFEESSRMVIATWRDDRAKSFGLSLDDGCLYLYPHPDFRWISTDPNGVALFAGADGIFELGFGIAPTVRRVQRLSQHFHRSREGIVGRASDGTWFVADGAAWAPMSRERLAGGPHWIDRVLAVSPVTNAMLVKTNEYRRLILALSADASFRRVELEEGGIEFPEVWSMLPGEAWAFTPDGLHVVARTSANLCFWCVETGRIVSVIPATQLSHGAEGLCFSPRGDRLLVTSSSEVETWSSCRAARLDTSIDCIRKHRAGCFAEINRIRESLGVPAACAFAQGAAPEGVPALQRGIYAARQGWIDHGEIWGALSPEAWF